MSETDLIKKGLSRSGRNAYKKILAEGNNAFVLSGNNICSVSPDGKKTVLDRLPQTSVRLKTRVFNLKKKQTL